MPNNQGLEKPLSWINETEVCFDLTNRVIASNYLSLHFRLKINVSDLWGKRK